MTTILIDNYDSFTWNLYQYVSELGANVVVFRNDQVTLSDLDALSPRNIIISPGPGHPANDSGISLDVISYYAGKIPILGVCLGEQCIAHVYGGSVSGIGDITHGKTSTIIHDGKGVFINVPPEISATRYHSLSAEPPSIPDVLEVTSWTENGIVMGLRHRELTIEGVQFHPESILSEHGKTILENFLRLEGGRWEDNPAYRIGTPLASTTLITKAVPSILDKIYKQRLLDVAAAKKEPGTSTTDLKKLLALHVAPPLIDFSARIKQTLPEYPAIMAEVKRASPSKGNINLSVNAAQQALEYTRAGASVISVLTEGRWFKGSLNDMRQVRDILSSIPNRPAILRKDFIVDTYQIMEARLHGADTILLIVSMLSDEQLVELYDFAKDLGMEPLVEVHDEIEMKRALALGAKVIGVNNRNLHNFEVDVGTTSRLAELAPKDVILAALSGISTRDDVLPYLDHGVGAFLIGEALMKAKDKRLFVEQILGIAPPTHDAQKDDQPEQQELQKTSTWPKSPLVKICGINTVEAAIEATDAGADIIGLIFAKSKRQVTVDRALEIVNVIRELQSEKLFDSVKVEPEEKSRTILPGEDAWFHIHAQRINRARKPLIVGVFQNQSLDEIITITDHVKLDLIQLHGDEPLDLARYLPVPAIKAFHIDQSFKNITLVTQPGYNAYVLLDTKVHGSEYSGGSGKTFDWSFAKKVHDAGVPVILAGGLTPDNVIDAATTVKPWIVDTSSGVETDGEKDVIKIVEFIKNAKSVVYESEEVRDILKEINDDPESENSDDREEENKENRISEKAGESDGNVLH
ncbi:7417_t:CDS:1 [Paraglomus brasilianum]|uniref:Multifunctional tryptophan biosynthesis protein n=1 Tax=Paraglomus brasilianum TaxID=144538 RepID=A0A9N8ZTZ8_9GLOM|nr:7417_t:CDS:1 [Paraglomus brasilianum]